MAITTKIKSAGGHDFVYPVILEGGDSVVLFIAPKTGTCLNGRSAGMYREDWADPEFYPWRLFRGTIVLENEEQPSRDRDNDAK